MARLNRLSFWGYALSLSLMSFILARSHCRGLPVAIILRMALPIAPNVSDSLLAIQASEHWHHLFATVVA